MTMPRRRHQRQPRRPAAVVAALKTAACLRNPHPWSRAIRRISHADCRRDILVAQLSAAPKPYRRQRRRRPRPRPPRLDHAVTDSDGAHVRLLTSSFADRRPVSSRLRRRRLARRRPHLVSLLASRAGAGIPARVGASSGSTPAKSQRVIRRQEHPRHEQYITNHPAE